VCKICASFTVEMRTGSQAISPYEVDAEKAVHRMRNCPLGRLALMAARAVLHVRRPVWHARTRPRRTPMFQLLWFSKPRRLPLPAQGAFAQVFRARYFNRAQRRIFDGRSLMRRNPESVAISPTISTSSRPSGQSASVGLDGMIRSRPCLGRGAVVSVGSSCVHT
jgi:hypothetical protein